MEPAVERHRIRAFESLPGFQLAQGGGGDVTVLLLFFIACPPVRSPPVEPRIDVTQYIA